MIYIADFVNPDFETQQIDAPELPALGHRWTEWEETKAATCTEKGERTRTCTREESYKEIEETDIDPDAHKWGAWTPDEDGINETRTCQNNPEHKETRKIEECEHNDMTHVAEHQPTTCTEEGNTEYYICNKTAVDSLIIR